MKPSAVAIGTFDGLHRGHRKLLEQLCQTAERDKLASVLIALEHPVRPVSGLLSLPKEKLRLLSDFPIDCVIVLPVSHQLVDQPADYFLENFLIKKLNARHLVVGENFAFGHGRHGTVQWLGRNLPAHGIALTAVRPLCYHGKPVSSTRIRMLIEEGRLDYANRLLGRFYQFEGMPVPGRRIGRTLGFPTINLRVAREKLLPPGVHVAVVQRGRRLWPAVISIGRRPTFEKAGQIIPEINLLGFSGEWPAVTTRVHLCRHLRRERRFPGIEELKIQIAEDVRRASEYFGGCV